MSTLTISPVTKLWGITRCIHRDATHEIHHASAKAGGYSSRHSHRNKINLFYVMSGRLLVHRYDPDEEPLYLEAGSIAVIESNRDHRFEAGTDVELIEVYWLDPLDPDDIVRADVGGIGLTQRADP